MRVSTVKKKKIAVVFHVSKLIRRTTYVCKYISMVTACARRVVTIVLNGIDVLESNEFFTSEDLDLIRGEWCGHVMQFVNYDII